MMHKPEITAFVVDDEPWARKRVCSLLTEEPQIRVLSESSGGYAAVKHIIDQKPDLVFLDVQMPELDGFGIVEEIGKTYMPVIIFITGFSETSP